MNSDKIKTVHDEEDYSFIIYRNYLVSTRFTPAYATIVTDAVHCIGLLSDLIFYFYNEHCGLTLANN